MKDNFIEQKPESQVTAIPSNVPELYRTAELLQRGGLFPNAGNAAGVFTIIQYGKEIGLAPVTSLKNISIVRGNICMTAQVMLSLARKAGVEADIKEETTTGCTINFKRGTEEYTSTFNEEDARRVKIDEDRTLLDKDNWKNYPAEMYRWRAASKGLRVIAPDITAGTYTPEEISSTKDKPQEPLRVKPVNDVEEDILDAEIVDEFSEFEPISKSLLQALHAAFTRLGLMCFRDEFKAYCADREWIKDKGDSFSSMGSTTGRELLDSLEENMITFYATPKYHTSLKNRFRLLKLEDKRSVLIKMACYIEDIDSLPKKISDMSEDFTCDTFSLFLTVLKNQHHNKIADSVDNGVVVDDAIGELKELGMEPEVIETAQIVDSSESTLTPGFF